MREAGAHQLHAGPSGRASRIAQSSSLMIGHRQTARRLSCDRRSRASERRFRFASGWAAKLSIAVAAKARLRWNAAFHKDHHWPAQRLSDREGDIRG
jgi:hypothetical protein